jgi:hypothetical protein
VCGGVEFNLAIFVSGARQCGGLTEATLSEFDFMVLLRRKIESLDAQNAKKDIERFILDSRALEIWSQDYFLQLAKLVKFK